MPSLNAPTQTNPPFTSPPTWPFPTTALWWEADYRLRLLEAAIIYAWQNGLPPSGPGTGAGGDLGGVYPNPTVLKINGQPVAATIPSLNQTLVWNGTAWTPTTPSGSFPPNGPAGGDLSGTYPNPSVNQIRGQPVSGTAPAVNQVLAWNGSAWIASNSPIGPAGGDLASNYPNPTVKMNVPAPVSSGAGFTTFIDSLGDTWVAKGGVRSGVWYRAREALHVRYYLQAASLVASPTTAWFTFDTLQNDPWGMYNAGGSGTWLCPLAGLWRIFLQVVMSQASGQVGTALIADPSNTNFAYGQAHASAANWTTAKCEWQGTCSLGQQFKFGVQSTAAGGNAVVSGNLAFTHMTIHYLGTG